MESPKQPTEQRKRMGPPPRHGETMVQLGIDVPPKVKEHVRQRAAEDGVSMSEYVLRLIRADMPR